MEKINILIVEDRPENIVTLDAVLQREYINIISTTDPNEALRLSGEIDIAIAIIDVGGAEMDGYELAEILQRNPRTKGILILFLTAISKETKRTVKGLNAGAVDYLYQPLDLFVTSAKVDSFIQVVRNHREIERKNKELKIYQEELIRAMELAEQGKRIKENFLANMSDEIRTPINGIIGIAQLLKKTALTDEQWQMVNLLEISSNSLLGVINDVLDLSKIESGKFKINRTSTDIAKICETVVNLLRIPCVEKKLNLAINLDPDLPKMILADSFRLNQILMTLIGNAIKFTNEGSITLKVEILNTNENNVQLKFSVNDSGIGIAKENIDKIFETFEQADEQKSIKFGVTGLGLSIVKTLAKLKGGVLEVQSKEFKGSTFCFTNWYEISKEIKVNKKPMEERLIPLNNIKILVAEDNPINKFLIIKILQNWQIETDVVENGKEAIDKLREKDYNLILMDTFMPVMNGLEAIKLIREGYASGKENIPIISFSAAVMETDKETAIAAGANDVMSKPFEPAALHKKILEYATD